MISSMRASRPADRTRRAGRGFTLVELILVIFRIAEKIAPLDENAPQEEDVLSKLKK